MSLQLSQYKLGKLPGDGAESVRVNGEAETKDGGGVSVDGGSGGIPAALSSDAVSISRRIEGIPALLTYYSVLFWSLL